MVGDEYSPEFIKANEWPSESPDLKPLDYSLWAYLEEKLCYKRYHNLDKLKSALVRAMKEIALEKTLGNDTVTRRSRRLQELQSELSTVLAFPARKKMEREENRPFCHRWRDPTVFSGESGEDSQRWLSDFQRVARYNK
ncbi:hypothetical protein LAZ67_11001246 [Cordylochernes scorpioides]|uniref:Uncharacterized protein n=1 Tax=Cordylochernes scorpioides TaxID=51811 RepID=A0ABY6KYB9_9ARAC|nr:hypothetical protein LAZ67_11001246 [Cordylochernes scorpioides]